MPIQATLKLCSADAFFDLQNRPVVAVDPRYRRWHKNHYFGALFVVLVGVVVFVSRAVPASLGILRKCGQNAQGGRFASLKGPDRNNNEILQAPIEFSDSLGGFGEALDETFLIGRHDEGLSAQNVALFAEAYLRGSDPIEPVDLRLDLLDDRIGFLADGARRLHVHELQRAVLQAFPTVARDLE